MEPAQHTHTQKCENTHKRTNTNAQTHTHTQTQGYSKIHTIATLRLLKEVHVEVFANKIKEGTTFAAAKYLPTVCTVHVRQRFFAWSTYKHAAGALFETFQFPVIRVMGSDLDPGVGGPAGRNGARRTNGTCGALARRGGGPGSHFARLVVRHQPIIYGIGIVIRLHFLHIHKHRYNKMETVTFKPENRDWKIRSFPGTHF